MRPIVAIAGAAILVLLTLLCYFVPTGFQQGGSLYAGVGPLHALGSGSAVVEVPSSGTFLPSLPVNLTVSNVPSGARVFVFPCPIGVLNASACLAASPGFIDVYNVTGAGVQTVFLHFNINVGHAFAVTTSATQGAQATYKATVPFWALQTWIVVILLVASVVLVAVGLAKSRPPAPAYGGYDDPNYAGGTLRRFCENCGNRFNDESTMYCPTCGAPRMG